MRILFIADNFPPEVNAAASRVFERAKYWVQWGHDVTVITCAPNFPQGKVYPGYKNKWYQVEAMSGIKVVRVKTFIAKNEGFLMRIIDFISFMWMAICASFFNKKPDVIIATSPQFFSSIAGYVIAVCKSKPFFFELSDLWPASIAAVGSISSTGKLYRAIEKVELFLYKRATKVIAQTNGFKQDLIARGIDSEKISVVPNGVELNYFKPIARDQTLINQYHLENQLVIGYIGTHGMAHDLAKVLKVAEHLINKDITFLFVGDGAEKTKLESIKQQQRLNNVIFVPPQPKHEISRYWSICDIALIHLKNDDTFSTVVPSKLFEAMAMGVPIMLVAPRGEAAKIVESEQVGWFVHANDQNRFIEIVSQIEADKSQLNIMSNNALTAAKVFSREKQAHDMLAVIEDAIRGMNN